MRKRVHTEKPNVSQSLPDALNPGTELTRLIFPSVECHRSTLAPFIANGRSRMKSYLLLPERDAAPDEDELSCKKCWESNQSMNSLNGTLVVAKSILHSKWHRQRFWPLVNCPDGLTKGIPS
jgi:hypothetical protein